MHVACLNMKNFILAPVLNSINFVIYAVTDPANFIKTKKERKLIIQASSTQIIQNLLDHTKSQRKILTMQ